MTTNKITFRQKFNYIIISFIAGFIGTITFFILQKILGSIFGNSVSGIMEIVLTVVFTAAVAAVTAVFTGIVCRNTIYDQYYESEDKFTWLKNFISYIAIGEIIKFIFNLLPLWATRFGSKFNIISYLLYDGMYLRFSPRYSKIMDEAQYMPIDFIMYFFVQLLSLIPIIAAVALVYRYHWHKADKEHRELTKYQR